MPTCGAGILVRARNTSLHIDFHGSLKCGGNSTDMTWPMLKNAGSGQKRPQTAPPFPHTHILSRCERSEPKRRERLRARHVWARQGATVRLARRPLDIQKDRSPPLGPPLWGPCGGGRSVQRKGPVDKQMIIRPQAAGSFRQMKTAQGHLLVILLQLKC